MISAEQITENIRKIRVSKEISSEFMAEKLNISISAYSKLENKHTQLTIDRLLTICSILQVSLFEMVDGEKKSVFLSKNEKELYERIIEQLKVENKFLRKTKV